MPELPEVETVRRGLQPAMEGSKILKAEARRKDLRFPFQKDFIARLEGQTVTGLGRRAKYLMADLASGDVLLMHLGMSGSFRVLKASGNKTPGQFHHPRSEDRAHDHVVFHMSSGAAVDVQRSAPLRLHEDHRPQRAGGRAAAEGPRPRAARQ